MSHLLLNHPDLSVWGVALSRDPWVLHCEEYADILGKVQDFPGGPVVKTSLSDAWGVVSIPGQGAKIQYASPPKQNKTKPKTIKQKQYCDKFNANLKKNGPH